MTVQHLSALLTYVTKKPVKMKLSRAESLLVHPKRHPFYMDMTMGCDENGNIMGVKAKVASDTGAFASLGGPVLERACTHAAGPYHYENFEIEGTAYYTNNPPAGAFPWIWCYTDLFCNGNPAEYDGRQGRHHSLGDSLPKRHPSGRNPSKRTDCG